MRDYCVPHQKTDGRESKYLSAAGGRAAHRERPGGVNRIEEMDSGAPERATEANL